MSTMAILTKTRYVLAVLFGFMLGFEHFTILVNQLQKLKYKRQKKQQKKQQKLIKQKQQKFQNSLQNRDYRSQDCKRSRNQRSRSKLEFNLPEIKMKTIPSNPNEELYCMTLNIYLEAPITQLGNCFSKSCTYRVQDRRYRTSL